MIENLDTDLAVKEDNSATDLLNNSVQQVSVSLVHHSNLNLEIVKREEEEPCSGGELNDESSDEIETFRKQIYSQARSINKSCLAKPKEQRLHDSISKVFGVDDPPPGFGHCYPRHYFLEQNLPRPISPLKVILIFSPSFKLNLCHFPHTNTTKKTLVTLLCRKRSNNIMFVREREKEFFN